MFSESVEQSDKGDRLQKCVTLLSSVYTNQSHLLSEYVTFSLNTNDSPVNKHHSRFCEIGKKNMNEIYIKIISLVE